MKKIRISVIVPVYNVEKYMLKCIDSIINQTYKNLEIILIDDGSSDSSGKICDEYSIKDSRIKVKHIKNSGVSNARNLGIKLAKGDYITFVDSDDYIELNMYEEMLSVVKENVSPDLISSGFYYETENGKKFKSSSKTSQIQKRYSKEKALKETVNGIFGATIWNKLFKRELILQHKLEFNSKIYYAEDYLFLCQYISNINYAIHIEKDFYHYIKRYSSATNGNFNPKMFTAIDAFDEIEKIIKNTLANDYFDFIVSKSSCYCSLIYNSRGQKKYYCKRKEFQVYLRNNIKIILFAQNVNISKKILILLFSFNIFIGCITWSTYKKVTKFVRKFH